MRSNKSWSVCWSIVISAVIGRLVASQGASDSSATCIDTYKVRSGVKSSGGTLVPQITDTQGCLDACSTGVPSCVGVDIVGSANPIQCWFHFNLNDFVVAASNPGGSQQVMQRCPWSNLYTCTGGFVNSGVGQVSPGGVVQPASVNTVDRCKSTCVDQGPGCAGIDFDTNTNLCYVLGKSTLGKNVKKVPGVQEYTMISACATTCTPTWARYIDTAGVGATPVSIPTGNSNVTGCLEWCLRNPGCGGAEFTASNALSCAYYSTSQTQGMQTRSAKPGTTQYPIVNKCSQFCQAEFVPSLGSQFFINNAYTQPASTLQDCANWCTLAANCTIYQVPKSGPMVCTLGTDYVGQSPSTSVDSYTWQTYNCKP